MANKEHDLTRFLDDCPGFAEKFHADPDARAQKTMWESLRADLRQHLAPPPLEHPDFLTSRVLAAIAQESSQRGPSLRPRSLRRMVFAGLGSLATAALLTLLLLPEAFRPRSQDELISQVISARTFDSRVSVSSFSVPETRGVVVWVEGANFIPPREKVR